MLQLTIINLRVLLNGALGALELKNPPQPEIGLKMYNFYL